MEKSTVHPQRESRVLDVAVVRRPLYQVLAAPGKSYCPFYAYPPPALHPRRDSEGESDTVEETLCPFPVAKSGMPELLCLFSPWR